MALPVDHLLAALKEIGDPRTFIGLALEVAREHSDLFEQPGAVAYVAAAAQRVATTCAELHQQAEPAPPAPQSTAEPQKVEVAQAGNTAAAGVEAAAAPPAAEAAGAGSEAEEEQPKEDEEPEASTGLKPNANNGADLDGYSWTQTLAECVASFPVPPGTRGRDCAVSIGRSNLSVGLKGQPPILAGELYAAVKPDDSCWNIVDGRLVEVSLAKLNAVEWWKCVVRGEPEINVQQVEPESSKLSDLDPEMRATVEKMMFDQRQKALGLPTSEEQQKEEALKKFMAAHPELDFSQAKFM